jgi:hypothetical protein
LASHLADPEALYLIEVPVAWLARDGFAKGISDQCHERERAWAANLLKQGYWDKDYNGRPRGEALRVAATVARYFYEDWRDENKHRRIDDYGHRGEMRDCAAEVIVTDYFAWRFGAGVRPVFVWELGGAKNADSLIEAVLGLMGKPKGRREPGIGEELAFPMSLKFPPKPDPK